MSHVEHERAAAGRSVRVAIITLSDSRGRATDKSGDAIEHALRTAGFEIAGRDVIRDDAASLRALVERLTNDAAVDAILTTGGTGLSPRDVTVDTLRPMFDVELPGFGELFRMLSWHQVGPAAMLSRATAGVIRRTFIATLPGSPAAVELALSSLLVPQLRHVVAQLDKPGAAKSQMKPADILPST